MIIDPAGISSSPRSLGSFLWFAMVMGALSLLTPCVFPMVPITVSYFSNRGAGTRMSAVLQALVYGFGIVLTFSGLGLALSIVFGAGGINQLAANPWVNLLIAAVFVAFALSLFGVYFIQVPSGLLNRLDAKTRNGQAYGAVGAFLMGLTFTLTSFTCTGPFIGTLLVMAAQGNWRWPMAGMLAYSAVFALPFFILAMAPRFISQLPRAGSWMNSVKVLMGFTELAAAIKFVSNADLVWHWGIFSRNVVLGAWTLCGVSMSLYLLRNFRRGHNRTEHQIGAFRMVTAVIILGLTCTLIPGFFGSRLGELESFLPPSVSKSSSLTITPRSSAEVMWINDNLDQARTIAKREQKLVFIDFTGYTCTNCRWMEANMFTREDVKSELEKFVTVRLYTDGYGTVYEKQQAFQQEKFGTVALPLYAILRPDGTPVSTLPGLTRDYLEFMNFLKEGRSGEGKITQQ